MTWPQIVGVESVDDGGIQSDTIVQPVPAEAADDQLLFWAVHISNVLASVPWPAGWTEVSRPDASYPHEGEELNTGFITSPVEGATLAVAKRVASSEPADYTLTLDDPEWFVSTMLAVEGTLGVTPSIGDTVKTMPYYLNQDPQPSPWDIDLTPKWHSKRPHERIIIFGAIDNATAQTGISYTNNYPTVSEVLLYSFHENTNWCSLAVMSLVMGTPHFFVGGPWMTATGTGVAGRIAIGVAVYDAAYDPEPESEEGEPMPLWRDQSGHGNHATSVTAIQQPHFYLNMQNGLPGVYFDVPDQPDFDRADRMRVADCLGGVSEGEAFLVHKRFTFAFPDETNSLFWGLWMFSGAAAGQYSKYPNHVGGVIEESFGTDIVHTTAASPVNVAVAHIYGAVSKAGEWTNRVNGSVIWTTATNTPSFPDEGMGGPVAYLGTSTTDGFYSSRSFWFEFLFYSPVRTPTQRASIMTYLATKWGITL